MKDLIVVTGGAGFVGTNLIEYFVIYTKFKIISIDNYSSGSLKNHINNSRVKYINSHTRNIFKILIKKNKKINAIFHFGEFARIYQSFLNIKECMESNSLGSFEVFRFCLKYKIKLIYSATSASLGNKGNDKNLSPYAFFKSNNLEFLENLKRWFGLKYETIYFYNVYGPRQISKGKMATVIGIFEDHYKKNKNLPIVRPGTQTRKFTHINDTIKVCIEAWRQNKCRHYSISNKESYSIIQVAQMFGKKTKFFPKRQGERYFSSSSRVNFSTKIIKRYGKISLKNYIRSIKNSLNLKYRKNGIKLK